jgi:uncharacterized protein YyaL (SSP411 family)
MLDSSGRLLHRYKDGDAEIDGFVEDYAYLIWGLIELYETSFDARYLAKSLELNKQLLDFFWDDVAGGFYFTPKDGEKLIVRKKEIYDGAHPSGNSVAMLNLLRLSRITANPELEKKAIELGRAFSKTVSQFPAAYTYLMSAVDFLKAPSYEVVLVGDPLKNDTKEFIATLWSNFIPNKVVVFKPVGEKTPKIEKIAEYTKNYRAIEGKATAYVCSNFSCKKPTTDPQEMLKLLEDG